MINNKIIRIVKDNQLDKGWTFFYSCDLFLGKNYLYDTFDVSSIVRLITFANRIEIILSDGYLPSLIVNEIEWINKYIQVSIIVKNEDILGQFPSITFSSIRVEKSIDFNYIGIIGEETKYFIISDGFFEIDNTIENVYFENQNKICDYSFLNMVSNLIIISSEGNDEYTSLINAAKRENVNCSYFVNIKSYNKKEYDYAKNNGLELYVSDFTMDGIIIHCKNGDIRLLKFKKEGFCISYPIKDFYYYVGNEYKCYYYDNTINYKNLTSQVYSCYNGSIKKLNIKDKKIIEIEFPLTSMSDYVDEKFDSSIVDRHNDYSTEAIMVEYLFKLIPPLFDNTYKESSMYDFVKMLIESWNKAQTLRNEKIKEMYFDCIDGDFGFINLLEEGAHLTSALNQMVIECNYKGFYGQIKKTHNLFKYYYDHFMEIFRNMFDSISEKSSEGKFDKIDDEIAHYRKIINDKNSLIEEGKDVLVNKNRVNIFNQKIEDLLRIKKNFEERAGETRIKNESKFIKYCNDLLNGIKKQINDDSIGDIVKTKDETKISKFYSFVDIYLVDLNRYIEESYGILSRLMDDVDIPEDYMVYDKEGDRYIVINDLSEYETTKRLCEKYSLKCITRR